MSLSSETQAVARGGIASRLRPLVTKRRLFLSAFVFLAHVAGFLTSIRAVMSVRTSQGAVAWVVSLNTLPYVAVPAYWIFGRSKFQGYVSARRREVLAVDPLALAFFDKLESNDLLAGPEREHPLLGEKLARLPFTRGNDVELLVNGEETFPSIFEGIRRAQDYVLVQFYILRDDATGRELQAGLIERASAGVRCYVLYDEIGSNLPESYLEELRAAGVEVRPFHSTRGPSNRFQLNFRNHRKVVVVDGREAWAGGLNVGDEYLGLDPDVGFWRDTHLRLEGPVVQCVQVSFLEDWHWATGDVLTELDWEPHPAQGGASRSVLCLPTGPADELETCTLFFLAAIHAAESRLWIASPYFVPDEQFISALQLSALRGVDVRILLPDEADNALVEYSAWSYIEALEAAGVKVFRYTKGFMHHKVMVVDDRYSSVGTANFDNRSFRLNFEITVAIDDEEFTSQVVRMLEDDFTHARPMLAEEYRESSYWFRLMVRSARLLAPVQ